MSTIDIFYFKRTILPSKELILERLKPLGFLEKSSSLKAKGIKVKTLSLSFIALWMVLSTMVSQAQVNLTISKTDNSVEVRWPTIIGGTYNLWSSSNMTSWSSQTITATGSAISVRSEVANRLQMYRRVSRLASPNGGFLNLKNGQVLSNTVALQISGFTTDSSQVGYIALLDIVGSITNQIGRIDLGNITNRQFVVDTRYLAIGAHKFGLQLISLTGSETGDGSSITYSDPIDVVVSNPISLTQNEITHIPYGKNYVICEDAGYFENSIRTNIENVLIEGLVGFQQLGPHRDLRTGIWNDNPWSWNIMKTPDDWTNLNLFQMGGHYGISPTHAIFFGRGDQSGYYGDRNDPISQFSTKTLQGLSLSNRLTFGLFIGHEPRALIHLLGETRKRTLQELRNQGLFPRYFAYLRGPHDQDRENGDISEDEEIFWTRFINRIGRLNALGFSEYTYAQARVYASFRDDGTHNPVSDRFDWMGCEDLRLDEIVLER